jgi:hypothetical protein
MVIPSVAVWMIGSEKTMNFTANTMINTFMADKKVPNIIAPYDSIFVLYADSTPILINCQVT